MNDINLNLFANLNKVIDINVGIIGKFIKRNNTVILVSDVNSYLCRCNTYNYTFYNLARFNRL